MFIPVTTSLGDVSVTSTITTSGTLVAECYVEHEGMQYQPNAPVSVKFGDEVKFSATVVNDTQFKITVEGIEFIWYIRRTLPIPYIEGVGQQLIVGEILDGIQHEDGNRVELIEGDPLTGEPTVFYNDRVGNALLVVNTITGAYKSLTVLGELVGATALPGPHAKFATNGQLVIMHNVEESPRLRLDVYDEQLNLVRANWAPSGFVGSRRGTAIEAGDQDGVYIATNTSETYYLSMNGTWSSAAYGTQGLMVDEHSVYTYYSGGVRRIGGLFPDISMSIPTLAITPIFSGSVNHKKYIFTINQANSTLSRNDKNSSETALYIPLKAVPAMVVVTSEEQPRVVVSYFDDPVADIFDEDMNLIGELEVGRSAQLSEVNGKIISTLIYSDAPTISKIAKTQTFNVVHDAYQELNKELRITYSHSFDLPVPVELLNETTNILVNGTRFTGGILPATATITFIIPATPDYHRHTTVGLVGTATIVMNVVSTPRLFPDLFRPDTVYEAILRSDYLNTYQIRGLTEGYTTPLVSQSRAITLSVNGGEFASEVEVKEFDEVTVKFHITRFADAGPTRNVVLTYDDRDAILWDVIVMTLNGVTLSRASSKTKHKHYEHWDGDQPQKITAEVEQGPHEEMYAIQLQAEVDAGYYLHSEPFDHAMRPASVSFNGSPVTELQADTKQANFDVEGLLLVLGGVEPVTLRGVFQDRIRLETFDSSYTMTAVSPISVHSSTYQLRTAPDTYAQDVTYSLLDRGRVSEHATQHGVLVGSSAHIFDNTYRVTPATVQYTFDNQPLVHSAVNPVFNTLAYGMRFGTHIELAKAGHEVHEPNTLLQISPDYGRQTITHQELADPEQSTQFPTSRITLDIDYSVLPHPAEFESLPEHGALVKAHMEHASISADVSRFGDRTAFRYKRQAIGVESKVITMGTVHVVDVPSKRVAHALSSDGHSPLKHNIVNMEYERIRRAGQEAVSTEANVKTPPTSASALASAEFRVSNYSLGVVVRDDGLFSTQEEAEAYAQSLGVDEAQVTIEPEGDVWIVRVRPYDLAIQCIESDVELENKVFGFLHGG